MQQEWIKRLKIGQNTPFLALFDVKTTLNMSRIIKPLISPIIWQINLWYSNFIEWVKRMSNQNQIQVVIVPMDKKAYVKQIDESYESLSAIVDGNIGVIDAEFQVSGHHLNYVYCDSGKMDNYAPSRAIYIRDGKPGDIIFGDFIVTYINEDGNYISLTNDECNFILDEMDAPTRSPWPYILEIIQNKKV